MKIPKGFIKDSNGVDRRGQYILHEGQIIREAASIKTKEEQDSIFNREYKDLDATIREVLSRGDYDGPLIKDVYITKSGDNYKISETPGKNPVAIITVDNNVYTLEPKEIINQSDTKALSPNKDTAKAPKQNSKIGEVKVQDASKVTMLTEDGHVVIKEGEKLNQDQLQKLVKQINDLEMEQIKTATNMDDVNSARQLRDLNISQVLKAVDLSAPSDEELKQQEELKKAQQEQPIEEIQEDEQPIEEPTEQKPHETKTAMFIRRPNTLTELEEKINNNLVTPATYEIVDEITLDEKSFNNYATNLRQSTNFLKSFRPDPSNADFTCIAVHGPNQTLLIDNSGYDSAQYVSIA